MLSMFARRWWAVALEGLAAVVFGILALVWPVPTLEALVIAFGAFALVSGIFALIAGIAARWTPLTLSGVAGMLIGVLTLAWPNVSGMAVLYLIAAWAIVTGCLEIVAAIELRRLIHGEWLMVVEGLLSAVFGVVLVLYPSAGAVGLAWLIGAYAILDGILLIALGFTMRGWLNDLKDLDRVVERTVEDPSL